MQFLSISNRRDGVTESDCAGLLEQEIHRARVLYSQGFIRQVWHRWDKPGACLLWEAEREEQVRELLDTLPFAQARLVDVVVIPLKPWGGFGPAGPH
jgi:muconolactone delta-isomerase